MSKPTFYAVFVGINAYTNCRQLDGCINDVLAASDYFQNLCTQAAVDGTPQQINWEPRYLLLPHRDEVDLIEQKGIHFEEPTRAAIVDAFSHFQAADPKLGDYCFFYYCGHGSFVDAPPIFSEIAPDGNLQTLVCADSRNEGQRDLLDKELAFLIAQTLEGKTKTDQQKGIHFLSVFDSCHSGSITRSDDETKQRMEDPGAGIKDLNSILGFNPAGNSLYHPFTGKDRIAKDGMKGLSYISLSACRDAEVANERNLDSTIDPRFPGRRQHGVFTHSLLKTLSQSGTEISYGQLMRRVELEVRGLASKQIPVLYRYDSADEDLYFLRNSFKEPVHTFELGFRKLGNFEEWFLNAGAINGLLPSNGADQSLIKLTDGSERLVEVLEVKGQECLLDASAFTEADQQKQLSAVIHRMPFPSVGVGYSERLSPQEGATLDDKFKTAKDFYYIHKVKPGERPKYIIDCVEHGQKRHFYLMVPDGDVPIFTKTERVVNSLIDANHIAKWENTLQLNNPATLIPRSDIEVECTPIVGIDYNAKIRPGQVNAYDILKELVPQERLKDPDEVFLPFKKKGNRYLHPGLGLKLNNKSDFQGYWVSMLYLSSAYGVFQISDGSIELAPGASYELTYNDAGNKLLYPFMPVSFNYFYHEFGLTETKNYLLAIISKQPFSTKNFIQEPLNLMGFRDPGGFFPVSEKEDDWFTIKVPITLSLPLDSVHLKDGKSTNISRTFRKYRPYSEVSRLASITMSVNGPTTFQAEVSATNASRAKRVQKDLENSRSTYNPKTILPPAHLFNGIEAGEGIFSRSPASDPGQQISILELTKVNDPNIIQPDKPLMVEPGDFLQNDESIVPFGYDPEADIYFPIGYTNEKGAVVIETLPKATDIVIGNDSEDDLDINQRSVKKSIKLFFNKLIWSRLTGEHQYRSLSLIQQYQKDKITTIDYFGGPKKDTQAQQAIKKELQKQLKKAKKDQVLLLIHGIIGNTDAQVEAAFEKLRAKEHFGAILTYNYENLNTPIEETAAHLLACLKDTGIKKKQITILAHSMGGLVSRVMIEQLGGEKLVAQLIQAGTPNGGSETADFRKKITGLLGLGMNGLPSLQPFIPVFSFLGRQVFHTLNQMSPSSEFIKHLNKLSTFDTSTIDYKLVAGNTNLIEAPIDPDDPFWQKAKKGLQHKGMYLFMDYLVFDVDDNDLAVKVDSMETLPDPAVEVKVVACDHLSYFHNEESIKVLKGFLSVKDKS